MELIAMCVAVLGFIIVTCHLSAFCFLSYDGKPPRVWQWINYINQGDN